MRRRIWQEITRLNFEKFSLPRNAEHAECISRRWTILVAILNACDNDHEVCLDAIRSFRTPLVTSWVVLTEAAYLLGHSMGAQEALVALVERGAVTIAPLVSEDPPITANY